MIQSKKPVEQGHNQPELPTQMRAVLRIVTADSELKQKALPFVNIEKREIDWQNIFRHDLSSGHRAALVWAKICWLDEMPVKVDPFDRAFSMDDNIRIVVLEALCVLWGLS